MSKYIKLTSEEKETRRKACEVAKETERELALIAAEKAQKPVESLIITIEWRKSRRWGNNPYAEAQVNFKDGTFERKDGYTCSGCGYDKESTVIAEIFNDFLKYKLYQKHHWEDNINREKTDHPYGVYYYDGNVGEQHRSGYISKPTYNGGVGTSCYYRIGKFVGGKFENVANGKTFDVYKYSE